MRIRPSTKRMRVSEWKDWQREEYVGVHTEYVPAEGGYFFYQYRPQPEMPKQQIEVIAPQADYWLRAEDNRSVWQMVKDWLKK